MGFEWGPVSDLGENHLSREGMGEMMGGGGGPSERDFPTLLCFPRIIFQESKWVSEPSLISLAHSETSSNT